MEFRREIGRTPYLENLWKRLWAGRKRDYLMIMIFVTIPTELSFYYPL